MRFRRVSWVQRGLVDTICTLWLFKHFSKIFVTSLQIIGGQTFSLVDTCTNLFRGCSYMNSTWPTCPRQAQWTGSARHASRFWGFSLTCTLHHHITSLVTEIHVVLLYVWALITSTHLTEQCLWGKYNIWLLALTLGKAR